MQRFSARRVTGTILLPLALLLGIPAIASTQVAEDDCYAACDDQAQEMYEAGRDIEEVQAWWQGCIYGCDQ